MEYLRQRCADLAPPNSGEPQDGAEVSLAQFATIGGLTEAEYIEKMFDKLQAGQLMELLKLEAQCDLGDWIAQKFLEKLDEFLVVFRLSMNRTRDVALYCVCSVKQGNDPAIYVRHALPGLMGNLPKEAVGLDGFEINFCDMETGL